MASALVKMEMMAIAIMKMAQNIKLVYAKGSIKYENKSVKAVKNNYPKIPQKTKPKKMISMLEK